LKILDRYILSRFLTNFISSFVILMFIFIFQSIWLFIDDLAGKALDIAIIAKFLFYLMPDLVEKVLPLTVLLSSILTFGTFAENYEFAAMKASGISLQKAMRSLIVFIIFLGGVTFFFANNVIPASQLKFYNLRKNIAQVKPAAVIAEGVFSDFEGLNIKVDRKYGENDRFLENIIIHQKEKKVNNTVIKAKEGELISSEGVDIVQLVLKDGNYYKDLRPKSSKERKTHPFVRSTFDTYTINILVSGNDEDLEKDRNISTDKMKNITRLIRDIDSIKKSNLKEVKTFSKNISNRMGLFIPLEQKDSIAAKSTLGQLQKEIGKPEDSQENKKKNDVKVSPPIDSIANIITIYKEWQQEDIINYAKNSTTNILNSIRAKKEEIERKYKIYNLHILSLHKKYALAFACVILFFVGAPLGAIIRKGGLGLPMVIAILLFLTYYFIGVFAGNYAREGKIHPMFGAWLSTLIMLPLGIFLTKRATADQGLLSIGAIGDFFKGLFKRKNKGSEI